MEIHIIIEDDDGNMIDEETGITVHSNDQNDAKNDTSNMHNLWCKRLTLMISSTVMIMLKIN